MRWSTACTLLGPALHTVLSPFPSPPLHLVYDVTRRETFEDLEGVWMREVELYSNVEGAICMVVANKVDLVSGAKDKIRVGG